MKGYNIICTVKAFISTGLYFHFFAAPEKFAGLTFRQIFASSKPSFEYFDCLPCLHFHLFKPLAKIAKIKARRKNPLLYYISLHIIATIEIKI